MEGDITDSEHEAILNEEQIMLDEILKELGRRLQCEKDRLAAIVCSALEREIQRVVYAQTYPRRR